MQGAPVTKVAMSHGINANTLHGRHKLAPKAQTVGVTEPFLSVLVHDGIGV
jgi:hypothetical protein